ncbi:MAG: branched-chain amino acid ABC transporter permease, partial [Actinobacteria bacterium]|nr:branched-chain amino acid ABC transporter permease [Actinomycetota bacterium]
LSIQMCLVAILGGVGTVYGPILGSIVLVLLSESTRVFLGGGGKGLDLIVYGFLIIGVALFRPKGLYDLAAKLVPAGGRR